MIGNVMAGAAACGIQSPTLPGAVQTSFGPVQALLQQTPVTQNPLPQSVLERQLAPSPEPVGVGVAVWVGVAVIVGVGVALVVGVGVAVVVGVGVAVVVGVGVAVGLYACAYACQVKWV